MDGRRLRNALDDSGILNGKKSFRMTIYQEHRGNSVPSATSKVMVWKRSTNFKVRPVKRDHVVKTFSEAW